MTPSSLYFSGRAAAHEDIAFFAAQSRRCKKTKVSVKDALADSTFAVAFSAQVHGESRKRAPLFFFVLQQAETPGRPQGRF